MDTDHSRTIVHIDLDCFYAQVEMLKLPEFKEKPLGVTQKSLVVTCNYSARSKGVGKCMTITDAKKVCPEIKLICGEDLAEYRRVSNSVHNLLCETSCPVERLGMDENWIDVTKLVGRRLEETGSPGNPVGHLLGDLACDVECGCEERLVVGSIIAGELRARIFSVVGLTSSAGVSYNKLLAKVGGARNKPDQQTLVPPEAAVELVSGLGKVTRIPGIGSKMGHVLAELGVDTVEQLKNVGLEELMKGGVEREVGNKIKMWALGVDASIVKTSGKQKVLGLEDTFVMNALNSKMQCRGQVERLVDRLANLILEDGRLPLTLKITVRDANKNSPSKKFHKESRQCKVSGRLWAFSEDKLSPAARTNIVEKAMELIGKALVWEGKFQVTLLGVAVGDFIEQGNTNINTFFTKKEKGFTKTNKPEADSRSFSELGKCLVGKGSFNADSRATSTVAANNDQITTKGAGDGFFYKISETRKRKFNNSDENEDYSIKETKVTKVDIKSDVLEESIEQPPSPILSRKRSAVNGRKSLFAKSTNIGTASNNLVNSDKDYSIQETIVTKVDIEPDDLYLDCPNSYDKDMWRELPVDIKRDLMLELRASSSNSDSVNNTPSRNIDPRCPKNCDPSVFNDLPESIKEEIIQSNKVPMKKGDHLKNNSNILNYFSKK